MYQIFKKEMVTIFHNLFQKIETERTLPHSFLKKNIVLHLFNVSMSFPKSMEVHVSMSFPKSMETLNVFTISIVLPIPEYMIL